MSKCGQVLSKRGEITEHSSYFTLENKCYHVDCFYLLIQKSLLVIIHKKRFNVFEATKISEVKFDFSLQLQPPENIRTSFLT